VVVDQGILKRGPSVRIVIAIGGNAIIAEAERGTWEEQLANARTVAGRLVELGRAGHELILTHGNGPQVGALHLQHAVSADDVPPLPLDALVAMTQGQLGFLLQTVIEEADPGARTATVLSRVRVDIGDPAFAEPTKPIGRFYSEDEARRIAAERGWTVAPDAGRGWRCMVASPQPLEMVDFEAVAALAARGMLVIASGGGGIPVARDEGGIHGVEAVIDKDRASVALALAVEAELLVMLTGVERIALDFGTRWQRDMARMTVSDALHHLADGEFPAGSMGPKVESAARFVNGGGRAAIVTSAPRLAAAVSGDAGTRIVPDDEGPSAVAPADPAVVAV
jgi:carbamate kinase